MLKKRSAAWLLALVLLLSLALPAAAEEITATPTGSTVLVDGQSVVFEAYRIHDYNYFKLRDLAQALNGSAGSFSVGWDGENRAVSIRSGEAYEPAGGELAPGDGSAKPAAESKDAIYLNGAEAAFSAYKIGGSNYFKLRDVLAALDVYVGWDGEKNLITIDTSRGYDGENRSAFSFSDIPAYSGAGAYTVNGGTPFFTDADRAGEPHIVYSPLDSLGRCGAASALLSAELMPTEPRSGALTRKPSGWNNACYPGLVEGNYLYNRCHLIGYQLGGGDGEENLITGTRDLNMLGMLPYETQIADRLAAGGQVLYRVTPVFQGDELLCRGVLLEGLSADDGGEALCFCVFLYNAQPGVTLDYATGESAPTPLLPAPDAGDSSGIPAGSGEGTHYVLNTNTHRFHYPDCSSAGRISAENRADFTGDRSELIAAGYSPCGKCDP